MQMAVSSANPFAIASSVSSLVNPISAVSGLLSNVQLYRIDRRIGELSQMMGSLQTMQIANLAVAGLGLGISVAGFALVKRRLDKVENKIDSIRDLLESWKLQAEMQKLQDLEARLDAQLDHAEEAWRHADGGGRVWTRVADELNDMVYEYPVLIRRHIDAEDMSYESVAYLLERFRVLAATRIECLILTGEMESASEFAMKFSGSANNLLNRVTPIELARRRSAAMDGDNFAVQRHLPEATRFVSHLREFQVLSESRPSLIASLIDRNVDGREYVSTLKEMEKDPVVVLPAVA